IGLVALPMALASIEGVRTRGKSRWFRGALLAFGVHGFTHLANSVAAQGYTTGVATALVIVISYWLLARWGLGRSGVHGVDGGTDWMPSIAGLPLQPSRWVH